MKYFPIIGGMDSEMLGRLIEFSNHNQEDAWVIVLNTSGGSFFATETMTKIINDHKAGVEIIVQGAYSSGFLFLMNTNCTKILSKSSRGMWHYGKWDLQYNDKGKPYYYDDECIIRNMPIHKRQTERLAKKIMTATEFKRFKADRDIYFDHKRMTQIFPDAKIM